MSISKNHFTYTWKIKNYSLCTLKYGESLKSPEFRAENLGFEGYLSFFPKGNSLVGYVSCYLFISKFYFKQGLDDDRMIVFEFEVIDKAGKTLAIFRTRHEFKANEGWGCAKLIQTEQLGNEKTLQKDSLTVRCRMTNDKLNKLPATGCVAQTKIGCKNISGKWNVKYSESLDWSESQAFFFPASSQIKISITAPENDFNINISMIKGKNRYPILIHCTISLLNVEGVVQHVSSKSHTFESADDVWNFPNDIKRSGMNAKENDFLKNDSFTLKYEMSFSNGVEFEEIEKYEYYSQCGARSPPEMDTIPVLLTDLKNMHIEKKHTDVELRIGQDTISAHKCILSARSPVFSAMFDQDMLEASSGVVDIEDIDTNTLNLFVEFLYTGRLDEIDYESALKLFVVGDKYQVNSLKESCSSFIISLLCHANVCDVLVFADKVGHTLLKAKAIDYIKVHKIVIFQSQEWLNCIQNNSQLVMETLCKLSEI